MKSKKIYIGVIAIIIILGIVIASIFYIKANNKDVEISKFIKNFTNENTKEAMLETKSSENTNDEKEKVDTEKTEVKTNDSDNTVTDISNEKKENTSENVKQEVVEEPKQEVVEEPKKEPVITAMSKTMYVKVDSLNVRSGPGTEYSRLGALKKADEVKITGKTDAWYRIKYRKSDGFVNASYLSNTKPEIVQPSVEVNNVPAVENGTVINNLIIINSRKNTLNYYVSGRLDKAYRCATGASGTITPEGKYKIFEKLENRPYYKLNIPGGAPNNPLGPRWMQFKSGGYAIHGTNTDKSIGTNASHGCVRMHNSDVIELYNKVPIGTTVIVKNTSQSDAQIVAGYGISINQ